MWPENNRLNGMIGNAGGERSLVDRLHTKKDEAFRRRRTGGKFRSQPGRRRRHGRIPPRARYSRSGCWRKITCKHLTKLWHSIREFASANWRAANNSPTAKTILRASTEGGGLVTKTSEGESCAILATRRQPTAREPRSRSQYLDRWCGLLS